jgi:phosphate transport system substrate-binding protein
MERNDSVRVDGRRSSPPASRVWVMAFIALLTACGGRPGTGSAAASGDSAGSNGGRSIVTIQNTGSDTLVNLALAWAEAYMGRNPNVRISVTGGGSGTGITALINGTIQIANASREMSKEEIANLKAKGITPVRFTVALDGIAIVANPENPVNGLTIPQLSDIYTGKITNWRDVGGENRLIVALSRESNSGTYVYFLEQVVRLGKPDPGNKVLFSPETLLLPSSEGISVEVIKNPNAIGYDGLGYVTKEQKLIGVAKSEKDPFVIPSASTVLDGSYPIARPLYMYTAGEPSGAVARYLQWIMNEGQSLVQDLGFVPLRSRSE